MLLARLVLFKFLVGMMMLGAGTASAQNYPSKPIRIVTAGAGGGADYASRLIAQGITSSLGQQVIIENRPSGVVPGDVVAKASPDGYTLLFASGSLWIGPFIGTVPYDPVKDFSPVSLTNTTPFILVVHPSLPAKSTRELVALAKNKPGELNYATTGFTTATRLATELFKYMARVKMVEIPYRSVSSSMIDLISGRVQVFFGVIESVLPHVKSGKLRGLAVTSAKPSPLLPGMPTVAASGVPGYESIVIFGMFAPAKTPDAIIRLLNQEIVRTLNKVDVKERFFNAGVETVGSSPEEFASAIKSDMATLEKLVKHASLRLQ